MPPTIDQLAVRCPRRDPPRWIVCLPLLVALGCQGDQDDGPTSPPRQHRAAVTVTEECQLVRGEVAKLRTPTAEAEAQAAADALRAEHPHADIPLELLIQEVGPLPGQGRPDDVNVAKDLDVLTRMYLCDPLIREVASRHFMARHPEWR